MITSYDIPETVLINRKKARQKRAVKSIVSYCLMTLFVIFFLFPFFFMLFKSFMGNRESYSLPVRFLPSVFTLNAYQTVLDAALLKYFANTVYVILFNIIAVPFSAALCAYGFAKVKFEGSEKVFGFVLATMMLPSIVIQIPLYVIFNALGWIGTLAPLTIPNLFGGGAINIFLIRQFMRAIPKDLENAAKIDGANVMQVFWYMMLPLCMAIITFIMVSTFLGVWNDFMGPLIYLQGNTEKYTLAIGIYYKFLGGLAQSNYPNQQMAVGILMIIPPSIVFFIFQKQLIEGVIVGSMKG